MATEIQQLADLIASSVSTLLEACKENNTPFPQPNEPFSPQSEAFRANKAVANATDVIAAAAMQLAERVLPPHISIMNIVAGHLKNAALRAALELNVTEILRDAGPLGLHVTEIANICGVDSNKLSRLLRTLALNQCYREITPDVYANTRISSTMDSGKSVAELLRKPEDKHDGTTGFAALLELSAGDGAKYSSHLLENLLDLETAHSDEPIHAPFNRVCNFGAPIFAWYDTPEQSYRRRRFDISMCGIAQMQPTDILDGVLDWKALPEGSVIVDVGGGIGISSVAVARNNKHLKFIVQDTAATCEKAKTHWSNESPEVTDRLTFTPHNFFQTQPVTNASVFILKQVLHMWGDHYCAKILKALRAAATPDTKLIVMDSIVSYACHDPTSKSSDLNHDHPEEAPAPLLPNFGAAGAMPYVRDIAMMVLLNSQERTIGQLDKLLRCTGWKIVQVKQHDLAHPAAILCSVR